MSEKEAIKNILQKPKTVAVVGASRDSTKDSHQVAEYLKANGYTVVPINPFADEVLGMKCHKSLVDLPDELQKTIDIVDIFRPPEAVPLIVDQAILLRKKHGKPDVIWTQLGIVHEEAAKVAVDAGFSVVMNKCMMVEHGRLRASGEDSELARIRARKKRELLESATADDRDAKGALSSPLTVGDGDFNQIVQRYPLIVIDCWAAWCGPCRMVAPIIDELAKAYAGSVVFGKLNVDENQETAVRFNVMSIPTMLIMKNGKEVDRIVGAVPKQSIEARLRRHL